MFKLVVLSCALALAVGKPSAIVPLGVTSWAGPLAAPVFAGHAAIATHAVAAAPVIAAAPVLAAVPVLASHNYRGPLSLAPGQPANILAIDGRPLDTLSVNVDRAIHYTAKAVDHAGSHLLIKRYTPLLAPGVAWSHAARVDWPAARVIAPAHLAVAPAHVALHAPITPLTLTHATHLLHH